MAKHVIVVGVPSVPYGPLGIDPRRADADYYRDAARNIRHQAARGEAFAGSNLTETVALLCEAVARSLDEPHGAFVPDRHPTELHDETERDAEYGGIMCAECGWNLGGRDAHPDAAAQHRSHTQPIYPSSGVSDSA